jgi:hypothetical protein
MTEMLVIHLRIAGLVQGVGFRQWTAREADLGPVGGGQGSGQSFPPYPIGEIRPAILRIRSACRRTPLLA